MSETFSSGTYNHKSKKTKRKRITQRGDNITMLSFCAVSNKTNSKNTIYYIIYFDHKAYQGSNTDLSQSLSNDDFRISQVIEIKKKPLNL